MVKNAASRPTISQNMVPLLWRVAHNSDRISIALYGYHLSLFLGLSWNYKNLSFEQPSNRRKRWLNLTGILVSGWLGLISSRVGRRETAQDRTR